MPRSRDVVRHGCRADISSSFFAGARESHTLRSLPRRVLGSVTLLGLVAALAAATAGLQGVVPLVVLLLVVNLTLAALARRNLQRSFHGLSDVVRQLEDAVDTMRRLSLAGDVEGELGELQRRLRSEDAVGAVASLQRLLTWNEVQYSPMGHWALNAVVAFDALLIEARGWWGHRHGGRVREWFHIVGDAEALLALGTLAFENPTWTLPVVHDDPAGAHLIAKQLRHPPLATSVAVGNEVEPSAAGEVLIVSRLEHVGKDDLPPRRRGERPVGESRRSRRGGQNFTSVGRAFARAYESRTTWRAGVSMFFAEVLRLRDIVVDAETPGVPPVLFLFDEILHGTNTVDRRLTTRTRARAALGRAPSAP